MKRLFRTPAVQETLAALFAAYLRLVYATMRWTRENEPAPEQVWARRDEGAILCFWHAVIPLSPNSWPAARAPQVMRALISRSHDGQIIALIMERLGFPAIRGSKQKATDLAKDKGGSAALRDMVRWVKGGGAVAITPDGPRGPARAMGEGPPLLARLTGAPVLMVGMAARPCLRLNSWDRTVVPLPFSRGAMVWDGPLHADGGDTPAALAPDWEARLSAVTDRAEALLA